MRSLKVNGIDAQGSMKTFLLYYHSAFTSAVAFVLFLKKKRLLPSTTPPPLKHIFPTMYLNPSPNDFSLPSPPTPTLPFALLLHLANPSRTEVRALSQWRESSWVFFGEHMYIYMCFSGRRFQSLRREDFKIKIIDEK